MVVIFLFFHILASHSHGVRVLSDPDRTYRDCYDNSDLASIENADLGVAMANSKIHVLNAAKFTTDSNDEDGVAKFLVV